MKKKLIGIVVASLMVSALSITACGAQPAATTAAPTEAPAETTAAPETEAPTEAETTPAAPAADETKVKDTITVTTKDQLATLEIPNAAWKEIDHKGVNEFFSDGDCAIFINVYKADAELPERLVAGDNYKVAYETVYTNEKYAFIISGLGYEADDFDAVKKAIDSVKIDESKITDEMLDHTVVAPDQYSIKDEDYVAWAAAPDGLNLRAGASENDVVIGGLPYATQVKVTGTILHNGEDTGWKRVEYNGQSGYVAAAFLSDKEPAPLPKPDPQPTPAPDNEYIGYQYAAADPWGGQISVTLRQLTPDGEIEWTYTDCLPDGNMIYHEKSTPYTNGYTEWYVEGMLNDDMTYNYAGNFKLQGDGVEFTFESGEVQQQSPNGDTAAYQVGPLLDTGTNTVFLEKCLNN